MTNDVIKRAHDLATSEDEYLGSISVALVRPIAQAFIDAEAALKRVEQERDRLVGTCATLGIELEQARARIRDLESVLYPDVAG